MASTIIMPKQGLQMTEGTIIKWLKKEGELVKEGEPLFEMETDKLTITMDSTATGTLLKIVKGEGEVVPITEVIAYVGEPVKGVNVFERVKAHRALKLEYLLVTVDIHLISAEHRYCGKLRKVKALAA